MKFSKLYDQISRSDLPSPDEVVILKSQQSVGGNDERVEEWTLDVYSVSDRDARRRARKWVRANAPTSRNLLNPSTTDETEQSGLVDFFDNSFDLEYREVEVLVVG